MYIYLYTIILYRIVIKTYVIAWNFLDLVFFKPFLEDIIGSSFVCNEICNSEVDTIVVQFIEAII